MIWRPARRIVRALAAARRIGPRRNRGRPQCFARSSLSRCSALFAGQRRERPGGISIYRLPPERAGPLSRPTSPTFPPATTRAVLSTITERFAEAENIYWGGGHAIGRLRKRSRDRLPRQWARLYPAPLLRRPRPDRRSPLPAPEPPRTPSSIPSGRPKASPASPGAWSGAWSGSTASAPMRRTAASCCRSSSAGSAF